MQALDRSFFRRPTPVVARELVGRHVVHEPDEGQRVVARIVETEAYLGPEDPGSHATRGRDTQAGRLWDQPGLAYVYVCYGIHQMLNVVAHPPGEIGAVLIRAAEPVEGLDVVEARRGARPPEALMDGPGKLAEALGVTRAEHEDVDFTQPAGLHLADGPGTQAGDLVATGRIGLSAGSKRLLRFVDRTSPAVSRPPPEPQGDAPRERSRSDRQKPSEDKS